ncbi:MAG: response regulator [Rudaea sp.]
MKILIVDDDAELGNLIAFILRQNGFETVNAADGEGALAAWLKSQPHLILLDMSMPRRSGLWVLERVRASSTVPIIMLTVRNSDEDVVRAFDLGADDYVTKPFSPQQLVARVRAALRRAGVQEREEVEASGVKLDLVQHTVSTPERADLHITSLEMKLLEVMMSAPGEPFTPQKLIERVWGYEAGLADLSLLKSLVRRVRLKIEPNPREPRYLKTRLGVGYVFDGLATE